MKIDKFNLDTNDLPLVTLDDVRDQVREDNERVLSWSFTAKTDMTRKDILTTLREFTEREFLVLDEEDVPIGRLQEPTPHPFPELYTTLRAECAKRMQDIRSRSSALLSNAKAGGEDVAWFIVVSLLDIERAIQNVRNDLEITLYGQYIHDIPMDHAQEKTYLYYAHNAFQSPNYALHVLEQSLSLLIQKKTSQNDHY